jgi:OmpA-OmpF porin, OOP family
MFNLKNLIMKNLICKPVFFGFLFAYLGIQTMAQQGGQIQSKYDFIPGEKVIYFEDFGNGAIGDFPATWSTNGSGEIVTSGEYAGRWFQMTKAGYYIPDIDAQLTDNFTIEFDLVALNTAESETAVGLTFFLLAGDRKNPIGGGQPGEAGMKFYPDYQNIFWNNWSEAREWQGDDGSIEFTVKSVEKYHLSIWVQKQRVRVYLNENKVLDLPNGLQKNYVYNIFRIETTNDAIPLIGNVRIAAGLPDMRNKLLTEGKIVSYGIQFDVNSDKVKPESFATLKEIAQVLKDNPTLKVKVVGHTDSDGDDAMNLDLSKRRGVSVKKNLLINLLLIASASIPMVKEKLSPLQGTIHLSIRPKTGG